MLNATTLNLIENEEEIREIITEYFGQNDILKWKYEDAIKTLIDANFVMRPTKLNLEKLGNIYLDEAKKTFKKSTIEPSTREENKIHGLEESIHEISTATPIKKLLYSKQVVDDTENHAFTSSIEKQDNRQGNPTQADFHKMSSIDKMAFLCEMFSENGKLDLMSDKIPKRFEPYLQEIKDQLKFKLQPMTTMKERQMLLDISKCKKKEDIDTILNIFYSKKDLDPMCRYLRLATATAAELWTSRQLLLKEHNESWYRSHVYTAVWDNAFMYDDHFNTKRADCYSNITKEFKDIPNQRVDFILRNINDDVDYLSVEEKPGLKGVKSDLKKGKILQQCMLKKWTERLQKADVMDQFEAITCQWEGLKLTIYGTKFVSKKNMVTYKKGAFVFPAEETHAASFARLLLAIISLKRLVLLNYSKLNATLETKYRHEIEMAKFSSDDDNDEIQLRSDSTAGWGSEVEDNSWIIDDTIDPTLKEEVLSVLKDIKLEDDIITYNDWEEFVVERVSNKRKR